MNTSPVCKCAVPVVSSEFKGECFTCGLPLPKEVKCCEKCWITDIESSDLDGSRVPISKPFCCNDSCPCHNSPNMADVMGKVDKMIGGAVRRLGSEAPNTEASEWEKGFDKEFDFFDCSELSSYEVKSFIRSLLLSEKNKAREEGEVAATKRAVFILEEIITARGGKEI